MNSIPKSQLVLGYKEFFKEEPPNNRLSILLGICKKNLIIELAGLNYRLKPKSAKYRDTSLETQREELKHFCPISERLYRHYTGIADLYKSNENDYSLIFIRQSCIYAIEEIIQSDLPEIENFKIKTVKDWDSILRYILAVNTVITKINEKDDDDLISIEKLNPEMLPINELGIESDPIYTIFRGYKLMEYFSLNNSLKEEIVKYFESEYKLAYSKFVYEILRMYLANNAENSAHDFYYKVDQCQHYLVLFEAFSRKIKSNDIIKLLSIKKFPFYRSGRGDYILTDNVLLLEKVYNQFINDFWFDHLKNLMSPEGKPLYKIDTYKGVIGLFFESYIKDIIDYAFSDAPNYIIKLFGQLKFFKKGEEQELADVYIRFNSKVLLGQVKSTTIYDKEKYSGDIETFYKNNRNDFFNSFGINQLITSIKQLDDNMVKIDNRFPANKVYQVFPIIVVNEKALQTPFMAKIFQDRFLELIQEFNNKKVHVYPLSIVHVSDLENLQDFLKNEPNQIWNILKFQCRYPKFMPPFYNSINRKDIRANYKRVNPFLNELVDQYSEHR